MQEFNKIAIDLEKACLDFESAQEEQLVALESGNLEDLMSLHDRRESAFCRLKECLAKVAVGSSRPDDMDFLGSLQVRLGGLMEIGKALDEAAADCQKMVVSRLGDLRRGKTALRGYSIKYGKSPDARFMSSRG